MAIYGRPAPRLYTPPLRPLNRQTSRGFEVIDFAELTGEPLLPWQRWAAVHAMELNPDGTFRFRIVLILVARQNGKSRLKRMTTLWRLYMEPRSNCLGVAQDLSLAREQWMMAQDTIAACPDLSAEFDPPRKVGKLRNVNGDEWFKLVNGSRYKISAASRSAGRGSSNDEVTIDELREQTNWAAWAALSKTTMARPNSQIWAMSNAGDDQSVVLNQLREVALAGKDPTVGIFEWSGKDDCELDDREQLRQANPGLGHIISLQSIMTSMSTDPPKVFRTEVLCQRVDQLDGAVDLTAWKACADVGTMDGLRDRIAACFDISPDGAHATLAVAAKTAEGRVRVEIVKAWSGADAVEQARNELGATLDKVKPVALAWYPTGPGGGYAAILRPYARKVNARPGLRREPDWLHEDGELTGSKVGEVCMQLATMAKGREIRHPGDPLLDAHIAGARKLPMTDGWRFTRRGDVGHVDAAYAAAGAIEAALTMPVQERPGIRVLSY